MSKDVMYENESGEQYDSDMERVDDNADEQERGDRKWTYGTDAPEDA